MEAKNWREPLETLERPKRAAELAVEVLKRSADLPTPESRLYFAILGQAIKDLGLYEHHSRRGTPERGNDRCFVEHPGFWLRHGVGRQVAHAVGLDPIYVTQTLEQAGLLRPVAR